MDHALSTNGEGHECVQTDVQVNGGSARFRENLDALNIRLDNLQRFDNILVMFLLQEGAELLCVTRWTGRGPCG